MKVFKFGGASIKDASSIIHIKDIIASFEEDLIIVVSASGKTTNALEAVTELAYQDTLKAKQALQDVTNHHLAIAKGLGQSVADRYANAILPFISIVDKYITKASSLPYDQLYDQIVSLGEMLSTTLVSLYLNQQGATNTWLDIRQVITTDDNYNDARVDWKATVQSAQTAIMPLLQQQHVITQGFLGANREGFTTTLGREGSDYTASILAYCLGAEAVMIWKDVPGVLNADPRYFETVTKIDYLSYKDAIEMTYFGAKVIHPKTIQPLQKKKIPLYVKSFLAPKDEGTVIKDHPDFAFIPPMIVVKPNQVLLQLSTRDYSFIAEEHLSFIYDQFAQAKVKINLVQHTAISLRISFDRNERKLAQLITGLGNRFDLTEDFPLKMITLRYYNDDLLQQMKREGQVVLEERMRNTAQLLLKV